MRSAVFFVILLLLPGATTVFGQGAGRDGSDRGIYGGVSSSCCQGILGNIDGDPGDVSDIADMVFLIDHLFIKFPELPCPEEADYNYDGVVDIRDLTTIIDCLFITLWCEYPCPGTP